MKHQMFPPNHFENSFEWFRNQQYHFPDQSLHQTTNTYHSSNERNYYEMNQYQNDMIQRYYGNMIQPYSQNQIDVQGGAQSIPMVDASPYSNPVSTHTDSGPEEISAYQETSTMFGVPSEYSLEQPTGYQNPTGQYPTNDTTFPQSEVVQGQMNYQMYSTPYGNPTYYSQYPSYVGHQPIQGQMMQQGPFSQQGQMMQQGPYSLQGQMMQQGPFSPQEQTMQQGPYSPQGQMMQQGPFSQQGQMMQSGPFTSPTMFAPGTPYPTQPKQLNQQNNTNGGFQFTSILNQFKNSSGSYDVPKMMTTAGQMMNTVNQVGGLFKQIGMFFK